MPAAFQGTSFLVTYPQSSLTKDALAAFFTERSADYYLIGCEQHADGGSHYHCLVHFGTKQRLSARAFDCATEHPNIQTVGRRTADWERVVAYVSKEDESPLVWGTPRHTSNVWVDIINATSRADALQLIAKEKPRDFVVNRRAIDYALDQMFPVLPTSSFVGRSADQFVLPLPLQSWVLGNFQCVF